MGQECVTSRGQTHPASIAMEQRLAQLTLEAADLCANRRLSHRNACRCAREMPFIGHRDEVRELPQLHNKSLSPREQSCLGIIKRADLAWLADKSSTRGSRDLPHPAGTANGRPDRHRNPTPAAALAGRGG